jgi:dethiobiotin synthetase
MRNIFVTGIGTNIGKTVLSAILVEKLHADYWKPVQSGDLENSDTLKVKSLVSNTKSVFHEEAYRLTQSLSPHHSARLDQVTIDASQFQLPKSENDNLIIEGVGGLMVPLSSNFMVTDLITHLQSEVILIADFYLGSINHTLLSLEVIKQKKLPFMGIIFNGEINHDSEKVILEYSGATCLGRIPEADSVDKDFIRNCISLIRIL